MLQTLSDTGRLSNTLLVFMSDNGLMLGEHRLLRKDVGYAESVRTPFILRWDAAGIVPRVDSDHIVGNVDLAPTFAAAAGTVMPNAEGVSMLPIITDPGASWRTDFLLEHAGPYASRPTFCGVQSLQWVYVKYVTGEEELYDLYADPYQLQNLASNPAYAGVKARMYDRLLALCSPPPPGFTP